MDWILQDVLDGGRQCLGSVLVFLQDVIVALLLQFRGVAGENVIELTTEKASRPQLVGILRATSPEEMEVVRHDGIGRAEQTVPGARMKQGFPDSRVHLLVEPATAALVDRHRLMDPYMPDV